MPIRLWGAVLDLLLVSGYVSNLEDAWEYPSLSRFLSRLAEMSPLNPHRPSWRLSLHRLREAPPQETMQRCANLEFVLDEVGSARRQRCWESGTAATPPSCSRQRTPKRGGIAHPSQRLRSTEAGGGLPVGVDRRVLGGMAREHPRRPGNARLGCEERTVDGPWDACDDPDELKRASSQDQGLPQVRLPPKRSCGTRATPTECVSRL